MEEESPWIEVAQEAGLRIAATQSTQLLQKALLKATPKDGRINKFFNSDAGLALLQLVLGAGL